jgi:hypothetical protein
MGITRGAIDHWLSVGRLQLLYGGVYRIGHRSLRAEGRRLAAVLACGPGAMLSHRSAGWETHGTRATFRADRAKDAALTASGHRVLRFTEDVEPDVAVRRLRALLA